MKTLRATVVIFFLAPFFFACSAPPSSENAKLARKHAPIPHRENERCLSALRVQAELSRVAVMSLLEGGWSRSRPRVRRDCRWLAATVVEASAKRRAGAFGATKSRGAKATSWKKIGPRLASQDPLEQARGIMEIGDGRISQGQKHLVLLAGSSSAEVRALAAEVLGLVGNRDVLPVLLGLLRDGNSSVAPVAARALGRLRSPEAVAGLAATLDRRDPDLKREAIHALALIADPSPIPALWDALSSRDSSVRRAGFEALRIFAENGEGESVVAGFLGQSDKKRRNARLRLRELGAGAFMSLLPEPDAALKSEAKGAQAKGGANPPKDGEELERLKKELISGDGRLSRAAAARMGALGDSAATPALLSAWDLAEPGTRALILLSLGLIGDTAALPTIKFALEKRDGCLVEAAVEALGLAAPPDAAPILRPYLNHGDEAIRYKTARSLGLLGNPKSSLPLRRALRDESRRVRFWSAWALGRLGNESLCLELGKFLKGEKKGSAPRVAAGLSLLDLGCRHIAVAPDPGEINASWRRALDELESRRDELRFRVR